MFLAFCLMAVALWSQLACVQGMQGVRGAVPLTNSMSAQVESDSPSLRTPVQQEIKMPSKKDLEHEYQQVHGVSAFAKKLNTVSVYQDACPGEKFLFYTCSVLPPEGLRVHLIRLALVQGTSTLELASARDCDGDFGYSNANGQCGCAKIDYVYAEESRDTMVLELGCFGGESCRMEATVIITTTEPTLRPSPAPSTLAPSAPSPAPTTAEPTLRPSPAPSPAPSRVPTRSPSPRSETMPPSRVLMQQLQFFGFLSLSNVTVTQFNADASNSASFLGAVAGELGLSVVPPNELGFALPVADSLCCLTAADVTAFPCFRCLSPIAASEQEGVEGARRTLQSNGVKITYPTTLVLEDEALGANALYDSTVAQLNSSLSSGNLLSALQAVLSAEVSSAVGVLPLTVTSFAPYSDFLVSPLARTAYPTTAPTAVPSGLGSSSAGVDGALIGGVVAAAVVLLVLAFAALCFHQRKGTGTVSTGKVYIEGQKKVEGVQGDVQNHASP
ncbi:hypothetical protein B484DRAFT_473552 [Ochromonadaceae sp. CCMP2298]|nr:hypothetical protein B484DRAFT_473552 [Ochromonadaceae sp. CCMP2298]